MSLRNLATICLLLFCTVRSHAHSSSSPSYIYFPSDVDWVTRSSENFEVIYRQGQDPLAQRTLAAAEKAHRLIDPIFPPGPEQPVRIVLADFVDTMNGYSLNFPWPHMVLFVVPPEPESQLADLGDWLESLVLHEYVHTRHIWPAVGFWRYLRAVFGSIVLPNGLMPTHFHEGIATLIETEFAPRGRGEGAHFSAYRRMAVKEGLWNLNDFGKLDRMGGGVTFWPQGSSPYFFGYRFNRDLWERGGKRGIYRLTESFSSNLPFLINDPVEEVYGLDVPSVWSEIFKADNERVAKEIAEIESKPLSKQRLLTDTGFYKYDVHFSPDGKKVAYRNRHPNALSRIVFLDLESGEKKNGPTISSPASGMAWTEEGLFYLDKKTSDDRSFPTVYFFSGKGTQKALPTDIAVRAFDVNANGKQLVGYSEIGGKGSVLWWEIDAKKEPVVLGEWKLDPGAWVTSVLYGSPVLLAVRQGVQTELFEWSGPKENPKRLNSLDGHIYNLRRSDGNELLAIAEFDKGRREVYVLPTQGNRAVKKIAVLGGVNGFDIFKGRFLASIYRHGGYDIAELSTVSQAAKVPATVELSRATPIAASELKDYSPGATVAPQTWIPTVLVVPAGVQIGFLIPGFDIAQKHSYEIIGGYDTRGLPYASVSYGYRFGGKYTLTALPYFSPSYIQSTRSFFKQWGGRIGVSSHLESIGLNWSVGPAFKRIEAVNRFAAIQSVGLNVSLSKSWGFKAKPNAVAPVQGTRATLSHSQYFESLGSDDNYYRTILGVDQYVEAPWWSNHVWQFRLRMGMTEGTPVYNSFLEGGGELALYQGRSTFLSRGFLPGIFLGRRMASLSTEYKFPLWRPERGLGLTPIFLNRIHAEIFADLLTYDSTGGTFDIFKNYFGSVGAVLVSSWQFFYYVPTELRFGVSHGMGSKNSAITQNSPAFGGESLYFTIGIFASI